MTLSLLVYAELEHNIREQLANKPEFFPSTAKNKTTSIPTARLVFLKFEGIDTLEFGGQRFTTDWTATDLIYLNYLVNSMRPFIPELAAESLVDVILASRKRRVKG